MIKFAPLLCVAAVVLSACGTVEDETPQTSVSAQPTYTQKRVVHGPIVPDGPATMSPIYSVKKAKRAPSYAASSRSTRSSEVAVAPAPAPTTTETVPTTSSETTAPTTTPSTPAPSTTTADATPIAPATPPVTTPSTDATVSTPAPVTSEPLPAPTDTAPVETTPAAEGSQPILPGLDPARLPELLQMTFAGLPVWLIGLVGLVLVVALAIGFGGRRQREVEEPI